MRKQHARRLTRNLKLFDAILSHFAVSLAFNPHRPLLFSHSILLHYIPHCIYVSLPWLPLYTSEVGSTCTTIDLLPAYFYIFV